MASSASSSCPLSGSPGPSGSNSKPRTARASGVGFGGVAMARRSVAAVKLEPKPEPWAAAGAEEGTSSAVVPRSVEGPPLPAPFVAKTYEMVADAATDAVVSWAPGGAGNSFVVWDPQALAAGILPRFFKHANFASFIRQLNIYGFRKVNPDHWEFANKSFLAGQKHLLKNIKRRRPSKPQMEAQPINCAGACLGPPKDPSEVESLKRDRAALRAEVITLRQQYSMCKSQLVALEERILNNERNQQRAIAFFAKVLSNPAFVQQVLFNYMREKELRGAPKRQRLMENEEHQHGDLPLRSSTEAASATVVENEEHRHGDLPLRSSTEAASATVVAGVCVSAGSNDGGTAAKQEPVPELNGQEMDMDSIWYDVWDELDAIPGAEMDRRESDKGVAGFDVEDFSGRPCGCGDECSYLAEPMQFVEHYD